MAFVIVGLSRGHTRRQGEDRLCAVQCLHLALFIHAQDNGSIRRIQIQADYVPHLFDKTADLWKI